MDYQLRKSDSEDIDETESSTTSFNNSDTNSVHSSSSTTESKTEDGNGTRTDAIQKATSLPSLGDGVRKKGKAKRKGNIRKASSWSSTSGTFKKTTRRRSNTNNRDSYSLMSRLRAELRSTEVDCFGELTDDMSDELSFLL